MESFKGMMVMFIFFPIYSLGKIYFCISINDHIVSIRSADGVVTHYKALQSRIIVFFNPDKVSSLQAMRDYLKA